MSIVPLDDVFAGRVKEALSRVMDLDRHVRKVLAALEVAPPESREKMLGQMLAAYERVERYVETMLQLAIDQARRPTPSPVTVVKYPEKTKLSHAQKLAISVQDTKHAVQASVSAEAINEIKDLKARKAVKGELTRMITHLKKQAEAIEDE